MFRRQLCNISVLLVACAAACTSDDAGTVGTTAVVERGRIQRIVVATGTIEPSREVEVRSRIPGIIEAIHVADNDVVERGQPLIEIERDLLSSQVREAEAALEEARVQQRFAEIDLGRSQELERGGAASQSRRDDARAQYERATAGVARASAQLETLATQLSYATVRSPLAGRVLQVHVEEGSAVSPVTAVTGGTLLLSLAATDRLHLEGLVDENEIARVKPEQPAHVRTEAYADRIFRGVVSEIAPLGTRIQNVTYFEVKIEIVDADAQLLRPRMSGDAEIVTEVVEQALIVPETALRYRGEQIFVEVSKGPRGSRSEEREVDIGIVEDDRVQVLRGLEEGEVVTLK
ncbi:MAG: efflux RND transporter periplasmic adaptor subunit [Myxococcales bacterium]|nr:efflux RND transporter periplasmic adaptor subunit [Myxococcales bacterium]MDH5305840.1 efflux RND transporter periplasmic adaptor subunit [Myxococcales bacterium]MDH5565853.1 efflux RND transporter periplasmic adaptor subunit [Myxococcales bacterium]